MYGFTKPGRSAFTDHIIVTINRPDKKPVLQLILKFHQAVLSCETGQQAPTLVPLPWRPGPGALQGSGALGTSPSYLQ